MSNLELKAKVSLAHEPTMTGIIVAVLRDGKYKVLLDKDWNTGRTYVYTGRELTLEN